MATASARGVTSTDTGPQGTVSLSSTLPFDVIQVSIPNAPPAAPNVCVDTVEAALEPHLVRRRLWPVGASAPARGPTPPGR